MKVPRGRFSFATWNEERKLNSFFRRSDATFRSVGQSNCPLKLQEVFRVLTAGDCQDCHSFYYQLKQCIIHISKCTWNGFPVCKRISSSWYPCRRFLFHKSFPLSMFVRRLFLLGPRLPGARPERTADPEWGNHNYQFQPQPRGSLVLPQLSQIVTIEWIINS